MSGDDVLCLSHLRWGFVYQRPNHLMSRCARERRVFFVEEPHFDLEATAEGYLDVEPIEAGLHVAVPHLPPAELMTAAQIEAAQKAMLDGLLTQMSVRNPLLWFYTPMALGYARDVASFDASAIVYDCMDELSHFRGAPPELVNRERELFGLADLVFTGGQSLYEAKRDQHPRVHAFPSSVNAAHFGRARSFGARPRENEPVDQTAIPHPRIGFFGVVDERMDVPLIEAMAKARPDFNFVLLGPVAKIDPAQLPRLPNIHWLGQKNYKELPRYLAGWDVAMMPFARNDATKYISPTKTLEYMAAGKPIVSTSIRDVVRPYGEQGLVRIADDPQSFINAIEDALAYAGDAPTHAARDAFLAETSWDSTWARMNTLIHGALKERSAPQHPKQTQTQETPSCSTI